MSAAPDRSDCPSRRLWAGQARIALTLEWPAPHGARAAWWRPEGDGVRCGAWSGRRGPAGLISPPRADRRRARGSGLSCRAMDRRGTDLGPRRDHPWATPAAVMTDSGSAMRVLGRGGGRRWHRALGRGCLAQRDELQGRIHGPAHQLAKRALVLATVGHRGEHVFVNLRRRSDGNLRSERDPDRQGAGSLGAARNHRPGAATDLAPPPRRPESMPAARPGPAISEQRSAGNESPRPGV
jgi:hypothetical protein